MIYEDLYWTAATIYGLGVVGFWVVIWRFGRLLPWRPLRWWLTWLYLCVVLTPWQATEPEPYYAPAIIVGAFDFLDVGVGGSLQVLMPMIQAILVGTLVIVLVSIGMRMRAMKAYEKQASGDGETG
ncbi:hypothetical protein ABMA57_08610 [Saccharospirillum sp. HFRX-1]|uniref:hypothetical protein n=1 Tax=unclassified Saccharospirillum TaxID=2633430 RepID=UPI0037161D73